VWHQLCDSRAPLSDIEFGRLTYIGYLRFASAGGASYDARPVIEALVPEGDDSDARPVIEALAPEGDSDARPVIEALVPEGDKYGE
jgi:hypothetical protein